MAALLVPLLLLACSEERAPPRVPVPDLPQVEPTAPPDGWQRITFQHFTFIIPTTWQRMPSKGGPPLYASDDFDSGVLGGTVETDETIEQVARRAVESSDMEWGDTVDGEKAVYIAGTHRAENAGTIRATAVVFGSGRQKHWLKCLHFKGDKMTPTCRRVFGSIRLQH